MSTSKNLTLIERVQARRDEMNRAIAEGGPDRDVIEQALAKLDPMLTGDLDNLPAMVSRDLIRWLENNKYLAVQSPEAATPEAPAPEASAAAPAPARSRAVER